MCDALNALPGVRTLWSCEGHALRPSRPYVVFEATMDLALQVQRMLHAENERGTLRYWWRQTANFQESGRLQWLIEAPSIPRWHFCPVVRRKVDAELIALATLLHSSPYFKHARKRRATVPPSSASGSTNAAEQLGSYDPL